MMQERLSLLLEQGLHQTFNLKSLIALLSGQADGE